MRRTVVLIILDGFGIGPEDNSNPIWSARPQTLLSVMRDYPTTSLQASGIEIGLPWGETGNSEVGHLTIGAGRVIYQHFPRISMSIADGTFFENETLRAACEHARTHKSRIHFIGLLTDKPVHAHTDHLTALMKLANDAGIPFWLHLFADGKDSPPGTIDRLLLPIPADRIASVSGRYFGMDRTGNWDLTQKTYSVLTGNAPGATAPLVDLLKTSAETTKSEEFFPPTLLQSEGAIADGDAVVFFNFREDSIRQLASSFVDPQFSSFARTVFPNCFFATMTPYKADFPCPVVFGTTSVPHPLGEVLASAGKTQFRVTESYKYAHITYFFNALQEQPFPNEYRVLIPSLQTPHVAEHPELRAQEIGDRAISAITEKSFDFVLINFPNGDMIGHTGDYSASLTAVTTLDQQIARILTAIEGTDTIVCITSDHGNVERVFDPQTGRPDTSHDPNPVPLILIAPELKGHHFVVSKNLRNDTGGSLADVAPTILEIMQIPKPSEMTGTSLLKQLQ